VSRTSARWFSLTANGSNVVDALTVGPVAGEYGLAPGVILSLEDRLDACALEPDFKATRTRK